MADATADGGTLLLDITQYVVHPRSGKTGHRLYSKLPLICNHHNLLEPSDCAYYSRAFARLKLVLASPLHKLCVSSHSSDPGLRKWNHADSARR